MYMSAYGEQRRFVSKCPHPVSFGIFGFQCLKYVDLMIQKAPHNTWLSLKITNLLLTGILQTWWQFIFRSDIILFFKGTGASVWVLQKVVKLEIAKIWEELQV